MKKKVKNYASGLLADLGYTVVPNWRLEHHAQSEFLKKLFEFLKIGCVFDVGANEGQFGRFLRGHVGFEGLIVSFEPIPGCLKALREVARDDSNWLVQDYALGAEKGKAQFNVMAGTQFSSFLRPDHSRIGMFVEQNRVAEEIEIEVRTLDEVVPALTVQRGCSSIYLKLDTQGFDLNVAKGAGREISTFRALQTEVSVTPIYEGLPPFSESLAAFLQLGFELSGIFPNNPGHFPRMVEFDCHMINREWIPKNVL